MDVSTRSNGTKPSKQGHEGKLALNQALQNSKKSHSRKNSVNSKSLLNSGGKQQSYIQMINELQSKLEA